jgi:hypothetical protein
MIGLMTQGVSGGLSRATTSRNTAVIGYFRCIRGRKLSTPAASQHIPTQGGESMIGFFIEAMRSLNPSGRP